LCERGIRSYERHSRFTLDVTAIAWLKQNTHLPVIVDPSHAAGTASLVAPLARAGLAAGADGLMIEVHPTPISARSDAEQALTPAALAALLDALAPLASALGRHLVRRHRGAL
jgi:3-deoxy-7-phosphoheptulonate synthase